MAEDQLSGSASTPRSIIDEENTSYDDSNPGGIPGKAVFWSQLYSLADPQDAELSWSITDYAPSSPKYKDERISESYGIIRAGEITAIVGPMGSAADLMALILSGNTKKFNGKVECTRSAITFIEDIDDFKHTLPAQITVFEAVDFYLGVCIPPSFSDAGNFNVAAHDCVSEFDLVDVENLQCAYLTSTHSKLLYMLSMLLNPLPILILHNPERYLDDRQCLTIANRLHALAAGGHSILICSTQVSEVFLEICSYMHVFHQSGVVIYGGSPKGFSAFLLSQGIGVNTFSSISENVFRAGGFSEKIMKKIEYFIDKPPIPRNFELQDTVPEVEEAEISPTFRRHLVRTLFILLRNTSLLLMRAVIGVLLIIYCAAILRINSSSAVANRVYAVTVLDIVLVMTASVGLVFGYVEGRYVDVFLIQESRAIGRFSQPAVILTVRLITRCAMEFCTNSVISVWGLLICNVFGILSARACVLLLPICALLYGFLGAFCALFKNWSCIFLPLMLLTFMWSILATLTPMFEIKAEQSPAWRFTSPLYLVKAIVLTDGAPNARPANANLKYSDRTRDVSILLTIMDFRLPQAFNVTTSVAVLITVLIVTIAAYLVSLRILLKKD